MATSPHVELPADLAAELEQKYFWWEPVGSQPRSPARILAQALELAGYADIRRIECLVGHRVIADVMRQAEPGWIGERSWEFWRGRLSYQAGETIPDKPPQRAFDAEQI